MVQKILLAKVSAAETESVRSSTLWKVDTRSQTINWQEAGEDPHPLKA